MEHFVPFLVLIFGSMESLNDFYYFAKVVEHKGYAAAGRALGIPSHACPGM